MGRVLDEPALTRPPDRFTFCPTNRTLPPLSALNSALLIDTMFVEVTNRFVVTKMLPRFVNPADRLRSPLGDRKSTRNPGEELMTPDDALEKFIVFCVSNGTAEAEASNVRMVPKLMTVVASIGGGLLIVVKFW
ncbi:MAG: hypothetical protein AB1705_15250 [Verrucomicrobiota bacterium]